MPFLVKGGYLLLLGIGLVVFIFGLLQAAHPPFQRWWYGTRWYTPDGMTLLMSIQMTTKQLSFK